MIRPAHPSRRRRPRGVLLPVCTLVLVMGLSTQAEEGAAPSGEQPAATASGLPRIGHTDTLITLQALRTAPGPLPAYVSIINDYDAGVLEWEASVDRSWISVTPARATSNSTEVAIWVVDTDVALGRHTAHVVLESSNAVNAPDTMWVQLDVLCPVQVLGDANLDGRLSQADIIFVVNHVLRAGPPPRPVWQAGDINCDEAVSQSDIIALVNHLLRAGPPPCNVCQFF